MLKLYSFFQYEPASNFFKCFFYSYISQNPYQDLPNKEYTEGALMQKLCTA